VDADEDTLATAPHVRTDDLLKDLPEHAPIRPAVGIVRGMDCASAGATADERDVPLGLLDADPTVRTGRAGRR
jgi:hypothetical protein